MGEAGEDSENQVTERNSSASASSTGTDGGARKSEPKGHKIDVSVKNPKKKKKRKSLINRLSGAKTKTKTAQDIKAKQEQAAKKREEALNEKKEKAAEETDKLALAQEKATSDKAKKAKAKAEKEHVVAAVKVDIEKDGTKKPKKGIIQRLSGSK